MTTTQPTDLDELRFRLRGGVALPGDDAYEDACSLFNAMVTTRPRLVARCAAPDDVAAALGYARRHRLPIAVRGGGHSVTGHGVCDGGVSIDVGPMNGVRVDPTERTAWVQAGCNWGQLDRETQAYGLAVTGGRVPSPCVAGLTLGGGSGWIERKCGYTVDNLIAADVVTADGQVVVASEH